MPSDNIVKVETAFIEFRLVIRKDGQQPNFEN